MDVLKSLEKTWSTIEHFFSMRTLFLLGTALLAIALTWLHYLEVLPLTLEYFVFYSLVLFLFALWRPSLAFLLFIALLPLEIVSVTPREWGMDLRPYQWVALLIGLALLVRLVMRKLRFPFFQWHLVDTSLSVFVAGVFISGFMNGGLAIKQSIVIGSFLYLYFLGRVFLRERGDVLQALLFFVVSGSLSLLWGVIQNILFLQGQMSYAVMPGRPNGTLPEPDWLGLFSLLFLAVALISLTKKIMVGDALKSLLVPFLGLGSVWLILILTVSRSAWLGALVLVALFLLLAFTVRGEAYQFRPALLLIKLTTLAFALALIVVESVPLTRFILLERAESTTSHLQTITIACPSGAEPPRAIQSVEDLTHYGCEHILLEEKAERMERGELVTATERPDPNVDIRKHIYLTSWEALREHPILGIGWGNIGPKLGVDERGASYNASNVFLEVWLGGGLIALTGLLSFIGIALWRLAFAWRDGEVLTGAALLSVSAGLLIFNLFNTGLLLGFVWIFFALLAHHSASTSSRSA